jgi:uncharacterized membrane protein YphA (DoxX/SURF4 family)
MKTHVALWIVQVLLACVYAFSGASKFMMSVPDMQSQMHLAMPGWFIHFIGACELLGALGLLLPSLLRIRPGLTPLAAAGLVIIMCGAVPLTAMAQGPGLALFPLVVGLLDAFVVWGRWRLRPIAARASA